jgi:hypothetical protein
LVPVYERLPAEKDRQWAAFCVYRDLGPNRTLYAVVTATGRSAFAVSRWARDHQWASRVAAWDRHLDERRRRQQEEEVRLMRDRHVGLALAVQEKVALRLSRMTDAEVSDISHADMLRWLVQSTDLESRARGVSSPGSAPVNVNVSSRSEAVAVAATQVTETVVRTREDVIAAKEVATNSGSVLLGNLE